MRSMAIHDCDTYNVCLEYDMAERRHKVQRSHGTDRASEHDILLSISYYLHPIFIGRTPARTQYNYTATSIDSATESYMLLLQSLDPPSTMLSAYHRQPIACL